ncbi:MAG: DUF2971 domain-containing protein [Bacteroidales bacterium]|nr:DUF2971 domain-containing protein [Bacteroidales bacterium]
MKEETGSASFIREMLDKNDLYRVDEQTAQDRFNFFRGISLYFDQLDPWLYVVTLSQSLYYGRKGNMVKESLAFIEEEFEKYKCKYPNEYNKMSVALFDWAHNLECDNRIEEANKMIRQATLYSLVDDYMYDGFEFFSFRPCSKYVFSEIAEETLSLVNPKNFNDPMDTVGLEWLKNQEYSSERKISTFKQHREAMQNVRIRCFARSSKLPSKGFAGKSRKHQCIHKINPLMWAHYADAHKGICIRYCFNKELFPLHNEEMTEIYRLGNAVYKDKFSINEFEIGLNDALFAKSKVWKYENEVRLIYCSTKDLPDVVKVKAPGAIKAIYFGLRCSKEDEYIIRALVAGRDIELYRMITGINNVYQPIAKRVY